MTHALPLGQLRKLQRLAMRRHTRFVILFGATVSTEQSVTDVTVANISESGARLRGAMVVRIGQRITLRATNLEAEATVRWVRPGGFGITFDRPIDPLAVVRRNSAQLQKHRCLGGP